MAEFRKCEGAHWCTAGAVEGKHACAIHARFPQLNNLELPEDWKRRYDRAVYAQRRAMRKHAESEQRLKTRLGQ